MRALPTPLPTLARALLPFYLYRKFTRFACSLPPPSPYSCPTGGYTRAPAGTPCPPLPDGRRRWGLDKRPASPALYRPPFAATQPPRGRLPGVAQRGGGWGVARAAPPAARRGSDGAEHLGAIGITPLHLHRPALYPISPFSPHPWSRRCPARRPTAAGPPGAPHCFRGGTRAPPWSDAPQHRRPALAPSAKRARLRRRRRALLGRSGCHTARLWNASGERATGLQRTRHPRPKG